ncbi:ATP-binding protein [uncultured Desulfobacter sp.]|uniref:ATP-binding protein n=1 Tax=uncultured Desulfobacter sp. TaxID=240139 RepID=UPI0029F476DB|nr:ATP-binding protein [uncultured Desulfobacter sp.]
MKKTSEDKLELTLSVQDAGIGIPKAEQELIFQSFEQQKNQDTAKYGGTGLGLAITRRLVKLMKGTITVTSSPNQGSRFEVRFFNVAKIKTRDTEREKSDSLLKKIVFNRERILILDTIESNRLFCKRRCQK